MRNIRTFDTFLNEDRPQEQAVWKALFARFADELTKKKVPCRLVLNEFGGKLTFNVTCGWDYPDSLCDKIDDAAQAAGVKYAWYDTSADSSGGNDIDSQRIAGGPKRYKR